MMRAYIVTTASNPRYVLDDAAPIAVCVGGPDPGGDARSYAADYVKASHAPAYIFEVEISLLGFTVPVNEVRFVPAK